MAYVVRWKVNQSGTSFTNTTVLSAGATATPLVANTPYVWQVRAVAPDPANTSEWSTERPFSTLATGVLTAPTALMATPAALSAALVLGSSG